MSVAEAVPELAASAVVRTKIMVTEPAPQPSETFQRLRSPALNRTTIGDSGPSTLLALGHDVQGCRRRPLWRDATRGVCGEGPSTAHLMIVGEQPGDQEDLAGRPFVGLAGRLLDAALSEAGINRAEVFLTTP